MTTILLVDDDQINVRVFSKVLTKLGGMEVRYAASVEEIIQSVHSDQIDLVLLDVSLPWSYKNETVNGIKISRLLKSDPKTANLPILLVTAHAMQGDRERFLDLSGADGYASKPIIDHQAFIELIQSLVKV
ncbi:MAG: response regulator [Synechococcales bacterium]|jgi:CheY-like chemotaxis protein|nr:response regulator [Cyanobacteria bacterium REEB444]MEB3125218.1 response regulator [Synechococcales bacterium]